ncbi:sulfotransferase domain-containing protein [Streptomyces sp. NPDC050617]|uniref:sulfotransferase domain-containing protein n=1 Tax=Streptomyces sp. NPDC050617 TaxID=3154628 RepID=UPI00343756C4
MRETDALNPLALHAANVARLREGAVVVAGYPGSGAALVGNILLEAGFDYLDPYTEVVHEDGSVTPAEERVAYRSRLAASELRDRAGRGGRGDVAQPDGATSPVFVKTHRYPEEFGGGPLRAAVLLVRDPRDAVHSYYRWRQGFSESGEHGSFEEFLGRPAAGGLTPALDWAEFNRRWADLPGGPVPTLRFEDVKRDPVQAVRTVLSSLGIASDPARLADAARRSSFQAMQAHENIRAHDSTARIMRRGKIGEWGEWYTASLAVSFRTRQVRETAARFGYEL